MCVIMYIEEKKSVEAKNGEWLKAFGRKVEKKRRALNNVRHK